MPARRHEDAAALEVRGGSDRSTASAQAAELIRRTLDLG
jgi:hypothetical protein